MNYKIIFNIPNEHEPTEVLVNEDQMKSIEPALNNKKVIQINGNYYNTAYFAKAVKDTEANALEKPKHLELEQTTQTQSLKNNRQAINELKKELLQNSII